MYILKTNICILIQGIASNYTHVDVTKAKHQKLNLQVHKYCTHLLFYLLLFSQKWFAKLVNSASTSQSWPLNGQSPASHQ